VPTRTTAGADFRLATSSFREDKNLSLTGYWALTSTINDVGDSAAFGFELDYPNDLWELQVSFDEVQRNYEPAVGFTDRRDYRRYAPEISWNPRPNNNKWIRQFGFGAEPEFFTDTANRRVTTELDLQVFSVELHSGDEINVNVAPSYERLDEDFTISPGVTLPTGAEYSFTRYRVEASTASKRIIALEPEIEWGTFLSGHRTEVVSGVGIRPRPGVTINLAYEWNDVDLAEGSFQTRLYRVVADTQFSPFMYLVNNVQYDSVSRVLGWQSRFRWIVKPGNDIFVVYTHNWVDSLDPASRFTTLDRRAAAKAVYTKRF
jgi:hypothetical protein